jgi:hypothetical protein
LTIFDGRKGQTKLDSSAQAVGEEEKQSNSIAITACYYVKVSHQRSR